MVNVFVFVERLSRAVFCFFLLELRCRGFLLIFCGFLFERRWGKCLRNVLLSSRGSIFCSALGLRNFLFELRCRIFLLGCRSFLFGRWWGKCFVELVWSTAFFSTVWLARAGSRRSCTIGVSWWAVAVFFLLHRLAALTVVYCG